MISDRLFKLTTFVVVQRDDNAIPIATLGASALRSANRKLIGSSGAVYKAISALIAIAMVHSDNRVASAITMLLFATGVAASVLLIDRPFIGEILVGPGQFHAAVLTVCRA